ncbi:hypothetical protein HGRIS_001105 [Hohenbuehelia grisea]|uniref:Uncharacterized protein n=1 Tax=Hohenbuehelia grisea TaxID=104357 RepID=A0ABR3JP08_9AGAR
MDPSNRRISVTRRITYRYYYAPAVHGRSTLLSLHGVPSSSFDWHRQIEYFQDQWYGIIAPDGYAYWEFLRRIDAADVIEQNDPDCWRTYMALPGKTAEWLKSNLQPGWPEYLAAEELLRIRSEILSGGGVRSSLHWYHAQPENIDLKDNQAKHTVISLLCNY